MDDVSQVIVLTEETKVLLVKCLLLLDEKEVIGAIKLGGISCSPPPQTQVSLRPGAAAYLEKQVRGRFDPLLEQNTQHPVLLLEVEHSSPQLQTFLSQILWTRSNPRGGGGQSEISQC